MRVVTGENGAAVADKRLEYWDAGCDVAQVDFGTAEACQRTLRQVVYNLQVPSTHIRDSALGIPTQVTSVACICHE